MLLTQCQLVLIKQTKMLKHVVLLILHSVLIMENAFVLPLIISNLENHTLISHVLRLLVVKLQVLHMLQLLLFTQLLYKIIQNVYVMKDILNNQDVQLVLKIISANLKMVLLQIGIAVHLLLQ